MDLVSFIPGVGPTADFTPGASTPAPFNVTHTGLTDGTGPLDSSKNMAEIYNRLLLQVASVIVKSGIPINNANWTQLGEAVQAMVNGSAQTLSLVGSTLSISGGNSVTLPIPSLVGMVEHFATPVAPPGWLVANGAAVSRTAYSTLFAAIGTAYGAGDGSTTFNVPNVLNRFIVGSGGVYGNNTVGGSTDATLVSHTHTATSYVTDPGHKHALQRTYNDGNFTTAYDVPSDSPASTYFTDTVAAVTGITVGTTVASAGSSAVNANLPPYIGLLPCIKY